MMLKLLWWHEKPQIAQAIVSNKYKDGGITISVFKVSYWAVIIKTAYFWLMKINGTD